jgi:uncharacterized protein (DUF58 family)
MSKTHDALSEALGIENNKQLEVIENSDNTPVVLEAKSVPDDIEQDYSLSRRTFRDLIDKGNSAIEGITDLAKESESPRAYEVLATLIKTVADTTKDLYDLQKKTKDLKTEEKKVAEASVTNIDKAVFVGSTSDLLKQIKDKENENL